MDTEVTQVSLPRKKSQPWWFQLWFQVLVAMVRIIAERLNAADAARALRSPPEGNRSSIASAPVTPSPRKAVGTTHHPIRTRPGPPGARGLSVLWHTGCLPDRDMAIVRDAIVAAGVAVVSIGIWDLIFWVSSLQFPVE